MSLSLRDQLLKAGLVNEKQAREAERQLQQKQQQASHQQSKRQRALPSAQESAALRRAQDKAVRDGQLNLKRQEQAERKARQAQARQLIEQNRLPKIASEEYFNFVDGQKIRRICVDTGTRERLHRGELVIVRFGHHCELVSAEIAERVRERDPRAVVTGAAAANPTAPGVPNAADDAYRDFAVPDDLVW